MRLLATAVDLFLFILQLLPGIRPRCLDVALLVRRIIGEPVGHLLFLRDAADLPRQTVDLAVGVDDDVIARIAAGEEISLAL